jgi:protein-S-isoprenylcysteine O-methyltransferase Ste14
MLAVKIAVFVAASAGFLAFSRRWMADPRSHGFWRFFVFETVLALLLVNLGRWFGNPYGTVQLVSWILLAISAFLPLHGVVMLLKQGRPKGTFENTSKLVTGGLYRYIRHPMYASLLYLSWGAFLKEVSILSVILVSLVTVLVYVLAKVEERELMEKFGRVYASYMRKTRIFIPGVI